MNILFALYTRLDSNSGFHVASLARELAASGHDCVVAVPAAGGAAADDTFRVLDFAAVRRACSGGDLFRDGRGIGVFHAWSCREVVVRFHAAVRPFVTGGLFVHLEDNEVEIARAFLGDHLFAKTCAGGGPCPFPENLSHPLRGRAFLAVASGVTLIIEALADMAPCGVPQCCIWPAADERIFSPRPGSAALRERLGIAPGALVLVYTGNGHPANYGDIRSLYLAVHLLNRAGLPTRLVRTGEDQFPCSGAYREWADQHAVNLGFVKDHRELGDLLALSDFCVQPGAPGLFNDFRFPSKLPEFFASGRPVILPRTNIGLHVRHLVDGYVLDSADGTAISDAILEIHGDKPLCERLGRGARSFYEANFSWQRSAARLGDFYGHCLGGAVPPGLK